MLCLLVLTSLYFHYQDHLHPTRIIWRSGNRWFIEDETQAHTLTAINFFSRWLVILTLSKPAEERNYRMPWRSKRKFIMPFDALDKNTFRQLRVRLRIESTGLLNPKDTLAKLSQNAQHKSTNNV